ncbi:ras-related and estrogen-regulated growth inhibitor-like [Saccostrea echinata]|uniref:ras-related and estrogen-regulated growth inhibitor-like n=1 Tax=Saccostrea echinata TaxID=191078 RepID=UPI002A7EF0BB|nr:ras-related and estrogen-regulated growth inhibitor-like [Saccostrea echinata]
MKGPINILVLGKEGVGKTAIVVRFLTGRYLSEYASLEEVTYERNVTVDEKQVSIKITDVAGKNLDRKSTSRDWLHKIDGAVIVYSVTDRNSYDIAEVVMDWLRKEKKPNQIIPMVLLGNKCDLEHSRTVTKQPTEELEWRTDGLMLTECSASANTENIKCVFHELIRKISEKRDSSSKAQRKLSHAQIGSPKLIRASLRRRFSVFTRERTSTM